MSFQILETSCSLKQCNRVTAVLRRLVLGLLVNTGMASQDILLLSHGLVSQSLPLLTKRDRYRPQTDNKINHSDAYFCVFLLMTYVYLQREKIGKASSRSKAAASELPSPASDSEERRSEGSCQQPNQHAHPGGRWAQGEHSLQHSYTLTWFVVLRRIGLSKGVNVCVCVNL